MRIKEFIVEIERARAYDFPGGKKAIPIAVGKSNLKNIKPLPGGSGLGYYISKSPNEGSMVIYVVDPNKPMDQRENENDIIVGVLLLYKEIGVLSMVIPNLWQVGTITVDEKYRNLGVARSLYGIALSILKINLLAGDGQTPGGRRMWQKLHSIPGVEMFGIVSSQDIDSEEEELLLKRGGKAIHRIPYTSSYNSKTSYYITYYSFPVKSNAKEIASGIRGINVYNTDFDPTDVKLVAKWTGQ